MIFELNPAEEGGMQVGAPFRQKLPSEVGLREKMIEDWIASSPEILFQQGEDALVFAQSVSGQSMADVLALDSTGRLIVVEIKRDWSGRSTVAQLLEYAARLAQVGYEGLNDEAQRYPKWKGGGLYERFLEFAELDDFPRDQLGRDQRTVIVAPAADGNLARVVDWLRSYGVPIEFVPFDVFTDRSGQPRLLQIQGASPVPNTRKEEGSWAGHWIFNTNETHAPGAYRAMFERGVAAIYGYDSGPATLEGASAGDKVLAYVNRQGLRALGEVVSGDVQAGEGIFVSDDGSQLPDEYHLEIDWQVVLAEDQAVSPNDAKDMGYNLPVRTTFGRLWKGNLAGLLEAEMERRR